MTKYDMQDHGPNPYVVKLDEATVANPNYRTTVWTGAHLQLTLMCIPPGGDIGLEVHPHTDQFLRFEQGTGETRMGPTEDEVTFTAEVGPEMAVFVPAGTWHNVVNTGDDELKVYTLYGPPNHVPGTLHPTQHDAEIDPNED